MSLSFFNFFKPKYIKVKDIPVSGGVSPYSRCFKLMILVNFSNDSNLETAIGLALIQFHPYFNEHLIQRFDRVDVSIKKMTKSQ